MTATAVPATHDTVTAATAPTGTVGSPTRLWRAGLAAGAVAAAATTATVGLARAIGEAVAVGGEQLPLAGFALFVLLGALVGIVLAMVTSRRASRPRPTFVRTTVVLTALSIVPDVLVDATPGTKLVLALTHVIAAAIIVPVLAARLPEHV